MTLIRIMMMRLNQILDPHINKENKHGLMALTLPPTPPAMLT